MMYRRKFINLVIRELKDKYKIEVDKQSASAVFLLDWWNGTTPEDAAKDYATRIRMEQFRQKLIHQKSWVRLVWDSLKNKVYTFSK